MPYPRSSTVLPGVPGFYHCISRCVRRAWLCGDDPLTGRNFDHRRRWIEQRLIQLADSFAVGLYAWAVMSNHTHVVLRTDPSAPYSWSDEEVAARWVRLGPTLTGGSSDPARRAMRERALVADPGRLEEIRQRLGSVSWFMRFLNECIARQANAEDDCTGRFWEGRFKCQSLLDESSVLACMAYVDLNPIRAGLCDTLIDSDYTTIQRRLRSIAAGQRGVGARLAPIAGHPSGAAPEWTEGGYIALLESAMRAVGSGHDGANSVAAQIGAVGIRASPPWWLDCVLRIERRFGCAVGTPESLRNFALLTGRAWLKGSALGR